MKTNLIQPVAIAGLLLSSLLAFACSEEEPPPRHQYPIINARVYELQQAVVQRDRAKIDSLLSTDILDVDQGSDSLLSFVYGPDGDIPFETFGGCQIIQTNDLARVDCYVMDSTQSEDRRISFTYKLYADSVWLLKRFDPTPEDEFTTPQDTTETDSLE